MTLKYENRNFVLLSHRAWDGTKTDCTQEVWDDAMQYWPTACRWHFANIAAHGTSLIQLWEGSIVEFYNHPENPAYKSGYIREYFDQKEIVYKLDQEDFDEIDAFIKEIT